MFLNLSAIFMFRKLCNRIINQSAKRVEFDICKNTYHVLCVLGNNKYEKQISEIKWTCTLCIQFSQPFHIVEDVEFLMCLSENYFVSNDTDLETLREERT